MCGNPTHPSHSYKSAFYQEILTLVVYEDQQIFRLLWSFYSYLQGNGMSDETNIYFSLHISMYISTLCI